MRVSQFFQLWKNLFFHCNLNLGYCFFIQSLLICVVVLLFIRRKKEKLFVKEFFNWYALLYRICHIKDLLYVFCLQEVNSQMPGVVIGLLLMMETCILLGDTIPDTGRRKMMMRQITHYLERYKHWCDFHWMVN